MEFNRSNLIYKLVFLLYLLFAIKDLSTQNNEVAFALNIFVLLLFFYTMGSSNPYNLTQTKKIKITLYIFSSLGLLAFLANYHKVPYTEYFVFFRRWMTPLLFYPILSSINTISFERVKRFLLLFLVLQILFLIPQYLNFEIPFVVNYSNIVFSHRFSGTFSGNNFTGNLFVVFILILLIEYVKARNIFYNKKIHVLIIVMLIMCVILSGVKTALISLVVGIILIFALFVEIKKFLKIFSVSMIFILLFINLALKFNSNAFDRITTGINEVIKNKDNLKNSRSTLSLTFRVLDLIEGDDILLGKGMLFKNGYSVVKSATRLKSISADTNNVTDALLAIILVEFGLLGLLIFLMPFYFIWKHSGEYKKECSILFIILLIQTLTDTGMFNITEIVFVLLYLKMRGQTYSNSL